MTSHTKRSNPVVGGSYRRHADGKLEQVAPSTAAAIGWSQDHEAQQAEYERRVAAKHAKRARRPAELKVVSSTPRKPDAKPAK